MVRRRIIWLILATALLGVAARSTYTALAISYPAGWNLVSGPTGSTLVGATGSIYTAQPGDTAYEVLPANSPLKSGWGYWAYFPNGGSIQLQPGSASYSVDLGDGATVLVGNPSAANPATVTGADVVYTYTPGGDYAISTTIPAGQGAIVMGSGTITLTAAAQASAPTVQTQPAPTSSPTPTSGPPASSANLDSYVGLKSVALQTADLPGFSLFEEDAKPLDGSIASYTAAWTPSPGTSSVYLLVNILASFNSAAEASSVIHSEISGIRTDPSDSNVTALPSIAVGDEESAVSSTFRTRDGTPFDSYYIYFRRGRVVTLVNVVFPFGSGNLSIATNYAKIIDSHLVAVGASTGSSPTSSSAPPAHLFQATGSGDGDTRTFVLPSSAANVCVTLSGQSPSGSFGPDASLFFYEPGGSPGGIIGDYTSSGCQIGETIDGPGTYYIEVVATPWTNWSITVDPD